MAEKREQKIFDSPPGVHNLETLCAEIPSPRPIAQPAETLIEYAPEIRQEAVSIVESTSSVENKVPNRPVKFTQNHLPDELNMIDLMYQKERERRRQVKLNAKNKKRKSKKSSSRDSSQISVTKTGGTDGPVSSATSMTSSKAIDLSSKIDTDSESVNTFSHGQSSKYSNFTDVNSPTAKTTESIKDAISIHSNIVASTTEMLSTEESILTKVSI